MPTAIGMPKLGMTMNEGMVVAWPLPIGSPVEKGEIVLIIESEKAEVEIEAQASGFLRHIFVEPEETVPCGSLLGAITETADEPFDAEAFRLQHAGPAAPAAKPAGVSPPRMPPRTATATGAARGKTPVTPAARKRARELDIEVAEVAGSGPGGRVTREDVEEWAARRANLVTVDDGVTLDVPAVGEGETILLLPGFGTDVSAFSQQIPFLAQSHKVLGVNPRGVAGSSAPATAEYDVGRSARDAASVTEEPAHVIGASLGAAVALEMAIVAPEKVRSLTLLTPFVTANARLLAVCDAWLQLAAEVRPETLAQTLLPWFFSPAFLDDPRRRARTLRGLATAVGRVPAATLERTARGMRAWSGSRVRDLASVKVPTLVIAGGGDLLTPAAAAIAEAIPGAKLVVVPDAGHAVSIESPGQVNQVLREHLLKIT